MTSEPPPPPPPPQSPAPPPETLPPQRLSAEEEAGRDLPRLLGLGLIGLMLAGLFGSPVMALVCWLYSLPWLAGMLTVLTLGFGVGLAALEYIRLRGWRYSVRQMLGAALVLFLLFNLCAGLFYKQYQATWAEAKPLRLANWSELSLAQKHQLAQGLVDSRFAPTRAELLAWREHADYKERMVVVGGRFVREFAFEIGPWKLLGTECLIVRIDNETELPRYTIQAVRRSAWDAGEN